MAINREIWLPVIEENLFKGVDALAGVATDDNVYLNAKTVHIPSAGTAGAVTKDNTTYPVSVSERTDTEVTYSLSNYEVGPIRVNSLVDRAQLSYDKMQSVINDYMGGLSDRVARELMLSWAHSTAGKKVITTGAATAAYAPTAGGNRKAITSSDVLLAAKILDKQLLPSTDRYLILDSEMFYQLMTEFNFGANRMELSVIQGLTILNAPIYGFKVIQMPVVGYSVVTTDAIRAYGHAGATTDNAFGLAFHKSAVGMAKGESQLLVDEGSATMFADVVSATLYAGGSYRRYNKDGVVPIFQVVSN